MLTQPRKSHIVIALVITILLAASVAFGGYDVIGILRVFGNFTTNGTAKIGTLGGVAFLTNGTVSTVAKIPVTLGGTNATTAAAARTNLGLGNMSIGAYPSAGIVRSNGTAWSASIPKVSIALGGTNATNSTAALTNLGAAPLASPTFTGTPAAPNPAVATNSTQLATANYVVNSLGYFRQVVKTANATLTCAEIANTEITVNGTTNPIALTIPRSCGGTWGKPSFVINNARTGAYATRIRDTGTNASMCLVSSNATKGTITIGWSASVSGNQIACKESRDGAGTGRIVVCSTIGTVTGNNATAH
jgi:hypothetical protein